MIDLGKYSFVILASYGLTLALIGGVVGFYLLRNEKSKKILKRAEEHDEKT